MPFAPPCARRIAPSLVVACELDEFGHRSQPFRQNVTVRSKSRMHYDESARVTTSTLNTYSAVLFSVAAYSGLAIMEIVKVMVVRSQTAGKLIITTTYFRPP